MTKSVPPHSVACAACPLRQREAFRPNTAEEIAFIQQLKVGELKLRARTSIFREGDAAERLYTLLAGWAFRFKTLPDGRRQILNFLLPGDLVGLQSKLFAEVAHGAEALTDVVLCVFSRDRVWDIFRRYPQIAFDVTWLGAHEESLVDDNLFSVGRRSAAERMAALLLQLHHRAVHVGLGGDDSLPLPLSQAHIADALGLSNVHTNRVLQALRRKGLFELASGTLRLCDVAAMRRLARGSDTPPEPRPLL
jgi:CRP/FNR family transcriptional regulator